MSDHSYLYTHEPSPPLTEDAAALAAATSLVTPPKEADISVSQQSLVDDLIRKKRKAREHKACYPCRQRKVKCDLGKPCQTCIDRDHVNLCDYNPEAKRSKKDSPRELVNGHEAGLNSSNGVKSSSDVVLGRSEFEMLCSKLNTLQDSISDLKKELDIVKHGDKEVRTVKRDTARMPVSSTHIQRHGLHALNEAGDYVHFGPGSLPTMLAALKQPDESSAKTELREQLNNCMMPLFGLDRESATYPFTDLWSAPPHGSVERLQELVNVLPDGAQIISLWETYHTSIWVLFPGLEDPTKFREDLDQFLVDRVTWKDHGGVDRHSIKEKVYGKSWYWIGLLFAVLSSATQCGNLPRREKELTAQVYMCCAMECAKYTNYLSRANAQTLQTLTIIQNVLMNSMNAGTAWSMLGTTIRLAQGIGLHRPCPPGTPTFCTFGRSKLWWSIIWQDSMLSIIYDRAGSDNLTKIGSMPEPWAYGECSSYLRAMYKLAQVTLNVVHNRTLDVEKQDKIDQLFAEVQAVMENVDEHLLDPSLAKTSPQTLEYWNLFLHRSFCIAELCRPALAKDQKLQDETTLKHRKLCVENLINSVEAFLGLNKLCGFARQSWAAVHRGLSSALLLGILGEHCSNTRAQVQMAAFINALEEITQNAEPEEIAAPMQRGFDALRKLRIPGASTVDGFAFNAEDAGGDARNVDVTNGNLALNDSWLNYEYGGGMTSANDYLPHSIVNAILWGPDGPAGNPMAAPMPW